MQDRVLSPVEQAAINQQALVDELATRSYRRADPMAQAVLEALEIWCQFAENTGHPVQLAARQQIDRYVYVLDRMRAISAGIQLADTMPGGSNGRADRPHGS